MTPTVGANMSQKNPQRSHFRISSRSISSSFLATASWATLTTSALAVRTNGRGSGEPDVLRGLEALAPIVREDRPHGALAARPQGEADENIVAERRRALEAAHPLPTVEHLDQAQVERVGLLHEPPLTKAQTGPVRVTRDELHQHDLVGPNPAALEQLGDPEGGRADLVVLDPSGRRRGRAAAGALDDADGPRAGPAPVPVALGRHRDLRSPIVHARLKGIVQPAVCRA